ncbi:DNA methyltransferase [Winogradskyella maritima]|uniref:site-specific DNA-methyltransferase (cytosine-N(4)-specific) n=1 Tax=Winogradskyella maritima TaxID=1517766 RepID=A0ABV8AK04_9FLAO|nr:DNA methyltransferase [Winogradskyella maritima]
MSITFPFENIPVSEEWVFKNVKSTQQWTHGYHRYPAKFLPNLVKKIIEDYTDQGDTIADLFAGCGTTLVESKIHGRKSVGVDINPVAQLITDVKTNPIRENLLISKYKIILAEIESFRPEDFQQIEKHDRIDYWFYPNEKYKIAFLYQIITELQTTKKVKNFFLVALSNILKNCSKWLQSSTKPQVDPDKVPTDVFKTFNKQVKSMLKKNQLFFEALEDLKFTNIESKLVLEDARKTSIKSATINAIITSPPYVTSYEYADLHQLTGYWFDYLNNLREFRKNFIGTFYSYGESLDSHSAIAQRAINDLKDKNLRTAREVANYFSDMHDVANEMYRILKDGGKSFVVIGNTTFKDVKIQSAEIFAELLDLSGFEIEDVIKRSIPHKLIPTIRDKKTGKFTTINNKNSKQIYPEEYIIIAKKENGNH